MSEWYPKKKKAVIHDLSQVKTPVSPPGMPGYATASEILQYTYRVKKPNDYTKLLGLWASGLMNEEHSAENVRLAHGKLLEDPRFALYVASTRDKLPFFSAFLCMIHDPLASLSRMEWIKRDPLSIGINVATDLVQKDQIIGQIVASLGDSRPNEVFDDRIHYQIGLNPWGSA